MRFRKVFKFFLATKSMRFKSNSLTALVFAGGITVGTVLATSSSRVYELIYPQNNPQQERFHKQDRDDFVDSFCFSSGIGLIALSVVFGISSVYRERRKRGGASRKYIALAASLSHRADIRDREGLPYTRHE